MAQVPISHIAISYDISQWPHLPHPFIVLSKASYLGDKYNTLVLKFVSCQRDMEPVEVLRIQ